MSWKQALSPPSDTTHVYLVNFPRDFCVPHAPAALLKAALICAEIVHLESTPNDMASDSEKSAKGSLDDQLARVFGSGGIRITSRSRLPQGSGMGTSSILAGGIKADVLVNLTSEMQLDLGCISKHQTRMASVVHVVFTF